MNFEKGERPVPLCWRCWHWTSHWACVSRPKENGYCEQHEVAGPRCAKWNDWFRFKPYDDDEDREAILKEWRAWDDYCDEKERLELEGSHESEDSK